MPEGDKLDKRPKGHVITSLLQYDRERHALEFLHCQISLSNKRNRRYYRYQRTLFPLERTGEMSKRANLKRTLVLKKHRVVLS